MRQLYLTACVLALSGCATTSFAPPRVDHHQKITNDSLGADCAVKVGKGPELPENVAGARTLIRNYFDSYECAMRTTANGRQLFEVPAFLSLVGSTTAVALGAGPNVAIAGGAGNSIFTAGNSYYAPREQTAILSDAVDAIACIQTEAVGISPTEIEAVSEQQKSFTRGRSGGGGTIEVTVENQYFDMISSKLANVHAIAAGRLAGRGSLNAGSIASEIEALVDKIRKAEQAKNDPPATNEAMTRALGPEADVVQLAKTVQLDLNVLEPKLAKCVARAKA